MAPGEISGGDTAWVLTSTALVLFMTPGLAFFYGGLVRGENVLNTMMMCIISMGAVALPWCAIGFSLAFAKGTWFTGGIGYAGLHGLEDQVWPGTGLPALLFVANQMTLVTISTAIISGAVVERMRFEAYTVFIVLWSLIVYAPVCHWVWGGGWVHDLGAKDFAGGIVVHEISAVSALVLAVLLGPRRGLRDGAKVEPPHNVPYVILGGAMLWFGWSGFNGGSARGANAVAALAVLNTYLAGAASLIVWVIIERVVWKRLTAVGTITGAIVGLVIMTPSAGFVTPMGAVLMGSVGCVLVYPVFQVSKVFVDDALGCFPCHGVSGFVGTMFLGLFDTHEGAFHGAGWKLLSAQVVAAVVPAIYAALASTLLYGILSCFVSMRVSTTAEEAGIDASVHGEKAYMPSRVYVQAAASPGKRYIQALAQQSVRAEARRGSGAQAAAQQSAQAAPRRGSGAQRAEGAEDSSV